DNKSAKPSLVIDGTIGGSAAAYCRVILTKLVNPLPIVDELAGLAFRRSRKLVAFNRDRRFTKRQFESEMAALTSHRRTLGASLEIIVGSARFRASKRRLRSDGRARS